MTERRDGTRHLDAIDAAGLAALRTSLEAFWDAPSHSFKEAADAEEGRAR